MFIPPAASTGLICILLTCSAFAREPEVREFRFSYGATVTGLPSEGRVRVWLPVPPSNTYQKVKHLVRKLPTEGRLSIDPIYQNQILYFESDAPALNDIPFSVSYLIHRHEVQGLRGAARPPELTDLQRQRFLAANSKVPVKGAQLSLLENLEFSGDPLEDARSLYNRVDDHVRYDKSKPGYGHGDVAWVCDSRFGNCTDFHSLFISWARAKGLPARFEIGFPLPPERGRGKIGGYHCWAFFHTADKGWIPVDISEADKHPELKEYYFGNLTENRVTFTTGRDIKLIPAQDSPPLNYFVYPHIEVDGKLWPKEKTALDFSYEDVSE